MRSESNAHEVRLIDSESPLEHQSALGLVLVLVIFKFRFPYVLISHWL